jgi:hypothetical protein
VVSAGGVGGGGGPAPAAAQKAAKLKDIRRLLHLSGSDKLGDQVVDQMLGQFKAMAGPDVPASVWGSVRKEIKVQELIALIVPIYDRHLSHDEIKAIIAFYESPAGKKFVSVLPAITQESMSAGQTWGKQLAERIAARLKKATPEKGGGKKR